MASLTAFVLFKDGSYQKVTNYDVAQWEAEDYSDGYYRDEFSSPSPIDGAETVTPDALNFWFPDGTELTGYGGLSPTFTEKPTAKLPDSMQHAALRQITYERSILRFYVMNPIVSTGTGSGFTVTSGVVQFTSPTYLHKIREGSRVDFGGTAYYAVQVTGNSFGLSLTKGGAISPVSGGGSPLTLGAMYPIGEFFAKDIKSYSNEIPSWF